MGLLILDILLLELLMWQFEKIKRTKMEEVVSVGEDEGGWRWQGWRGRWWRRWLVPHPTFISNNNRLNK